MVIAGIPIGFQIGNQTTRRRSKTLKSSQRMGVGEKSLRLCQIHLAGQYLSGLFRGFEPLFGS